jgi:hypothetical protein
MLLLMISSGDKPLNTGWFRASHTARSAVEKSTPRLAIKSNWGREDLEGPVGNAPSRETLDVPISPYNRGSSFSRDIVFFSFL